ncbi:MAG TPA: oligosaccharide flippase family protein [Candidatus Thermoplasmatota archaeon]|nr:oligosaccharide flippase family protein [Candidatus Thermoplasmatota archaeon]
MTAFAPRALRNLLKEDLARGSGVNLAFTALHAVLGVAAAVVAARFLGPAGLGVVALGFMLLEFLSAFDNLPTAAFIREYSIAPERRKVATAFAAKLGLGLVTTVVVLALSPLIASLLDIPIIVPAGFALIPTVAAFGSVAIAAREARRDNLRRNVPGTVERLVTLALYVLILVVPALPYSPVALFVAATVTASVVGSAAAFLVAPPFDPREADWREARAYLSFGLRTQTVSLLEKTVFWIDILLIDILLGNHATTGLYRAAYSVMAYLPMVAGVVTIMLYPALSEAFGHGRKDEFARTFSLGFFYGLAIAIPGALVALLFPEFIVLTLFGPGFEGAAPLLAGLAPVAVLAVAMIPFSVSFPAMNRPDLALRLGLVMVVVNVPLDLVLIPVMGPVGAIVATAAAFLAGLGFALYATLRVGGRAPSLAHVREVMGR